jgi:hypothetical protein
LNGGPLCQWPTPVWVAEALIERHFPRLDSSDFVIEPSCGNGQFLRAIPAHVPAMGVEIDARLAEDARGATGREIITGDFRTVPLSVQATAIIGNPPFKTAVIDEFLARGHELLVEGGRLGFILPAYALQTARRGARYAETWSMLVEMIPRNVFPSLEEPLVFAIFSKDSRRVMVGMALYREAADVQELPEPYRTVVRNPQGPLWQAVCRTALQQLGGSGSLSSIYGELEAKRPSRTKFWREKVRQTLRQYPATFSLAARGHYDLAAA